MVSVVVDGIVGRGGLIPFLNGLKSLTHRENGWRVPGQGQPLWNNYFSSGRLHSRLCWWQIEQRLQPVSRGATVSKQSKLESGRILASRYVYV